MMAKHHSTSRSRDIYQEVTDSILASLEAGTAPWEMGSAFLCATFGIEGKAPAP